MTKMRCHAAIRSQSAVVVFFVVPSASVDAWRKSPMQPFEDRLKDCQKWEEEEKKQARAWFDFFFGFSFWSASGAFWNFAGKSASRRRRPVTCRSWRVKGKTTRICCTSHTRRRYGLKGPGVGNNDGPTVGRILVNRDKTEKKDNTRARATVLESVE